MNRANKALVVMVVATLGLWGCAQEKNHGAGSARIRALESKNSKLEEDFRAVLAARDQVKKKLQAAEEQKNQLGQQLEQLQAAAKERDELRQQVTLRVSERDALQTQFDQFRKGIRSLLGQADSVANAGASQPVTSAAKLKPEEKS
jgi:chromosome segregation ATPase